MTNGFALNRDKSSVSNAKQVIDFLKDVESTVILFSL